MEDWGFIILFVAGMTFLVWATNSLALTGITTDFNTTSIAPPDCEISGWDAPIDAVVCALSNVVFFFSLSNISSSYVIVNFIFLGLSAGLIFIIIKLVRGS